MRKLLERNNEKGFTLAELAVVFVVLSIIATANIPNLIENHNQQRALKTVKEIQTISEAARLFAYRNRGDWPNNGINCQNAVSTLLSAKILNGVGVSSPWNTPYQTSCTAAVGNKAAPLFVVVVKTDPKWSGIIANQIPTTIYTSSMAMNDTTVTYVNLPGSVPAIKSMLHRNFIPGKAYLNQMNTALDMNNQDIINAYDIDGIDLNATEKIMSPKVVGAQGINTPIFIDQNSTSTASPYYFDPNGISRLDGEGGIQTVLPPSPSLPSIFALTTLNANGSENAEPKNNEGSLSVNDAVLRSHTYDPTSPFYASQIGIPCLLEQPADDLVKCGGITGVESISFKKRIRLGFKTFTVKVTIPLGAAEGDHKEVRFNCLGGTPNLADAGRIIDLSPQNCKACGGSPELNQQCQVQFP